MSPGSLRNHVQMEPGQRVYGDILEKAGQKVHKTGQINGNVFSLLKSPKVIRIWCNHHVTSNLSESLPYHGDLRPTGWEEQELIGQICEVATLLEQFEHLINRFF